MILAEKYLPNEKEIIDEISEYLIEKLQDKDSSERQVDAMVRPTITNDDFTLIEVISEINEIAQKGTLPDGDGVNESTRLWSEDAVQRFREKYTVKFEKV